MGRVPTSEDRIVLVDDVITDGATKVETINRLKKALKAHVTGLIISVDRKEKNAKGGNAITALEEVTGVEVQAIITIYDIYDLQSINTDIQVIIIYRNITMK